MNWLHRPHVVGLRSGAEHGKHVFVAPLAPIDFGPHLFAERNSVHAGMGGHPVQSGNAHHVACRQRRLTDDDVADVVGGDKILEDHVLPESHPLGDLEEVDAGRGQGEHWSHEAADAAVDLNDPEPLVGHLDLGVQTSGTDPYGGDGVGGHAQDGLHQRRGVVGRDDEPRFTKRLGGGQPPGHGEVADVPVGHDALHRDVVAEVATRRNRRGRPCTPRSPCPARAPPRGAPPGDSRAAPRPQTRWVSLLAAP